LTAIQLGKQFPEFKDSDGKVVSDQNCISLVSAAESFHLEAESEKELLSWLGGLRNLLVDAGRVLVLQGEGAKGDPLSTPPRFMVLTVAAALLASTPQLDFAMVVKQMEEGAVFRGYSTLRGQWNSQELFFFYSRNGSLDPRGSLYWCKPGRREQKKEYSLGLSSITEVVAGKRTKHLTNFKCKAADDLCFSLITADKILDISGSSREVVVSWLFGIKELLRTNGGRFSIRVGSQTSTSASRA